ncbi:hypothetical protein [Clostridium baratii]|uniref:hypothetical protein n=1 Tax=Clostridium baratii TaxID=1561 RepID=UPI0030CCDD61
MKKNNKLIIILLILFSTISGSIFIKNINKENLLIINNTDKSIKNILLKNDTGNVIDRISELKSSSEAKIDLKNKEYVNLEYYYENGQSSESILLKDKSDKNKKIKVIIKSIYENGKLDIEVK